MSGNKRPLSPSEPERKRKQPRTLRSTLPTNGQTQSDQVFFPDIKSEAKDTIDNIEKALNLPYDLAKMIYQYMPRPLPRIQFWNVHPYGRATFWARDRKMYILAGKKGPVGPLEIKDETTSAPLNAVELFAHNATVRGRRDRLRFVARLENLRETKVVSWDTTEDQMGHSPTKVTFLKDEKDNVITDAKAIVSVRNQYAVSTRHGHLYPDRSQFNGPHKIRSIVSNEAGLATIDEKGHHVVSDLTRWWLIGDPNQTLLEVPPSIDCVSDGVHFAFLLENGRILMKTNKPSRHLSLFIANEPHPDMSLVNGHDLHRAILLDPSVRVKILAASSCHFAALLRYENGDERMYIFGSRITKEWRTNAKIIGIVGSSPKIRYRILDSSFGSDDRMNYTVAFAANLDNGRSMVHMCDPDRLLFPSPLCSLDEHVQTLYSAKHSVLICSESGNYFETDRVYGEMRCRIDPVVSVAATSESYVIVYSDGRYGTSLGYDVPDDIHDKIVSSGGIAEIYSDQLFYCAVLNNGTVVMWSSEN